MVDSFMYVIYGFCFCNLCESVRSVNFSYMLMCVHFCEVFYLFIYFFFHMHFFL